MDEQRREEDYKEKRIKKSMKFMIGLAYCIKILKRNMANFEEYIQLKLNQMFKQMSAKRILKVYHRYITRLGPDIYYRLENRFKTCMTFQMQAVHQTMKLRGIENVRNFLSSFTKKYRLKVKVM